MKKIARPRKLHYVDRLLQGRLIWAMIILQVVLIVGLTLFYRQQALAIYEQAIYSIHASSQAEISMQFVQLFTEVLAIYVFSNLFALWVADMAWVAMIRRVINKLERLIDLSRSLNFKESEESFIHDEASHPTLEAALRWRESERARWRKANAALDELKALKLEQNPQRAQAILQEIKSGMDYNK